MSVKRVGASTEVLNLLEAAQSLLISESHLADPRNKSNQEKQTYKLSMQAEIRTLEFWRAIIAECIATFFYVLMLCSIHQSLNHPKDSIATVQFYSAVAAGLAIASLTYAFLQVSGAQMNPAVTVATVLVKRVSVLRGALYICAQCGGSIAGAALVYGVYGTKYGGAKDQFGATSMSNFGMEFILTFLIVYVYFTATDGMVGVGGKLGGPPKPSSHGGRLQSKGDVDAAVIIGLVYMATLVAYRGALNPARALGPCFVAEAWEFHWVFWVGPVLGGVCAALVFTFIFNLSRVSGGAQLFGLPMVTSSDNCSVKSDNDEDMIDDLERVRQYKSNILQTYNETTASVYNTAVKPFKTSGGHPRPLESVYGGTKSLYNGVGGGMYNDSGSDTQQQHSFRSRTPGTSGFDCSRSMYGGVGETRQTVALKRSQSVHSKAAALAANHSQRTRHPQDVLPDEPAANSNMCRASIHHARQPSAAASSTYGLQQSASESVNCGNMAETNVRSTSRQGQPKSSSMSSSTLGDNPDYREYIRQKNLAAAAGGGATADQCSGSSSGYYSGGGRAETNDLPQSFYHSRQASSGCDSNGRAGGADPSGHNSNNNHKGKPGQENHHVHYHHHQRGNSSHQQQLVLPGYHSGY